MPHFSFLVVTYGRQQLPIWLVCLRRKKKKKTARLCFIFVSLAAQRHVCKAIKFSTMSEPKTNEPRKIPKYWQARKLFGAYISFQICKGRVF